MTSDVDSITKKLETISLKKPSPDPQWEQLHDWVSKYRAENDMTIYEFIENVLKLSPSSYYKDILCKSGRSRCPSSKEGTKGNALRKALVEACRSNNVVSRPQRVLNQDSIEKYYSEKMDEFLEIGIVAVLLASMDPITVEVRALANCDREAAKQKLSIADYFDKPIHPEIKWTAAQLASSPICLQGRGTGSIINVAGQVTCVTAKHVLSFTNGEEAEVYDLSANEFGKFARSGAKRVFGVTNNRCFHPTCDIAVVLPCFSLPLTVNHIKGLGNIKFAEQEKNMLQVGTIVWKHGCSSGITSACITSVSDDIIEVSSSEVGPFAMPGDSGSLVVKDTLGEMTIVGVVSYISINPNESSDLPVITVNVGIVPVWKWENWMKEELVQC